LGGIFPLFPNFKKGFTALGAFLEIQGSHRRRKITLIFRKIVGADLFLRCPG